MTTDADRTGDSPVSPDQAFSVLGNETRIQLLQALGDADDPLSFTELRDRVGIRQGGQFNYHLDKLVGHFVEKTDDGYALREPGRRVVQAILSGAVTDDPELEPTEIDFPCRHCGAPVTVSYSRGKMRMSCRECGGSFDESRYPPARELADGPDHGNISNLSLPPAGVQGRSAEGVMRAAATLAHLETLSASSDLCPRCAAPVEQSVASVCADHDASETLCDRCDHRLAVRISFHCTNCTYERTTGAIMALLTAPALVAFAGEHGLNTTSRGIEWGWTYDEDVRSVEPFEARFTFTIDEDAVALTVDENLDVVDVTRDPNPAT